MKWINAKDRWPGNWINVKDRWPDKDQACWAFGSYDGDMISIENIRVEYGLNKFDVLPCRYDGKDFIWVGTKTGPETDYEAMKFVIWWAPRDKDDYGSIYEFRYLPPAIENRWDIPFEEILEVYDKD